MSIGIFYASNKGFAADVAKEVATKLNTKNVFDIKDTKVAQMLNYDKLVIVVATHKVGEIQKDLAEQLEDFSNLNFAGKTVALIGLGDGVQYGKETFNDALGKVYDIVSKQSANVVGFTENTGYLFEKTNALRDGKFPGLALDLPNQSSLNEARITQWVDSLNW